MGNEYWIAAPEETEWRIPPEEFAEQMTRRWQVERIAWIDDPEDSHAFQFELKGLGRWVDGYFHKDGTSLILEHCNIPALGQIAVWYRSLVPPEQPLLIFNTSGLGYSELKPTDTIEDVIKRFEG